MTEKDKKQIIIQALEKYPGYLLLEALEYIQWKLEEERDKINKIADDIGYRSQDDYDEIPF